jgi:hypothetical protein
LSRQKSDLEKLNKKQEEDIAALEALVTKFYEDKDGIEAERDNLDVEKAELRSRITELEDDLEEAVEKLQVYTG